MFAYSFEVNVNARSYSVKFFLVKFSMMAQFVFICLSCVGWYMLCPFANPVACCCLLLGVVVQSLKLVKRLAMPTMLEFVVQSLKLVKRLAMPTMLGVVASVCT